MELEITKIKSFAAAMDSLDMSAKQCKVMCLDKLNQALFLRFVEKWSQNSVVSGPFLYEKACADPHGRLHATFSSLQRLALVLLLKRVGYLAATLHFTSSKQTAYPHYKHLLQLSPWYV